MQPCAASRLARHLGLDAVLIEEVGEGSERMVDERVVFGPATSDGPVAAEVRNAVVVLDGVVRQVRVLRGVGSSVPAVAKELRAV